MVYDITNWIVGIFNSQKKVIKYKGAHYDIMVKTGRNKKRFVGL